MLVRVRFIFVRGIRFLLKKWRVNCSRVSSLVGDTCMVFMMSQSLTIHDIAVNICCGVLVRLVEPHPSIALTSSMTLTRGVSARGRSGITLIRRGRAAACSQRRFAGDSMVSKRDRLFGRRASWKRVPGRRRRRWWRL